MVALRRRWGVLPRFKTGYLLRATACVVLLIDIGSSGAFGGEPHAGLYAFDIFSDSAPRPPRAVPGSSRMLDRPTTMSSAPKPHGNVSAAHVAGPLAVHPSAAMFPPVAPLE
jgi:hypothetical protein